MSAPAIKIVETVAVDFVAQDGQHWSRERDAQNYNAECAMVAILGPELIDSPQVHVFTTIRNLAMKTSSVDIIVLRNVMDRYLTHTLPAFMALEGPFSYGTGRQIETEDGQRFDNKHDAALHTLQVEFGKLFAAKGVTTEGIHAITNGKDTRYAFESHLMAFFKMTDDKGKRLPGYEQRFRDALQAIIIERSKPIKGKKRRAK